MNRHSGRIATVAIGACLCALALSARAQTDPRGLDIAGGDLAVMLDDLARQSGLSILYSTEQVRGLQAEAVRGRLTARAALRLILRGTGLEARTDRSGAVAIVPRPARAPIEDAEIIVTATRRDTSVAEVPYNIQVLSGRTLNRTGARRLADYARTIPGLTFSDEGGRDGFRPFLRGLRSGTDIGLVATTAVFVDDINVDRPVTFRPLDLKLLEVERIEVLRGPQGTLYGAGAIGGVIRYVSVKPDPGGFEGKAEGMAGTVKGGGTDYELTGSANLPIVSDKAALRVAAGYFRSGGYIDNARLGTRDVNDESTVSLRAALRLLPAEGTTIDLSYYRQRSQYGERSWSESTLGPDTVNHPNAGWMTETANLGAVNVEQELGFATLTSTTSLFDVDRRQSQDFTYARRDQTWALRVGQRFPLPEFTIYNRGRDDARAWAQEIRLVSGAESRLDWILGGYYYRSTHRNAYDLFAPVPFPGQGDIEAFLQTGLSDDHFSFSGGRETFRHSALFGEVGYRITPAWRVSLGARHYDFRRRQRRVIMDFWSTAHRDGDGLTLREPLPTDISLGRYDESGESYRFNTSYDLAHDAGLVYLTIAQGVRPGGYNVETTSSPIPQGYKQFNSDKIWNYEIGGRLNLGADVALNAALYAIDWSKMQTQVQLPTLNGLRGNAGKARGRGVELEIRTRDWLSPGLSLSLGAAWTDVRLRERIDDIGFAGERSPFVPRVSGSAIIDYARPLGDGEAGINLMVTYTGASTADFGPVRPGLAGDVPNPQYARLGDYWLANLGVRLPLGGHVLRLFVDNMFDTRGTLYSVYQASYSPYRQSFRQVTTARPRTAGASLEWIF